MVYKFQCRYLSYVPPTGRVRHKALFYVGRRRRTVAQTRTKCIGSRQAINLASPRPTETRGCRSWRVRHEFRLPGIHVRRPRSTAPRNQDTLDQIHVLTNTADRSLSQPSDTQRLCIRTFQCQCDTDYISRIIQRLEVRVKQHVLWKLLIQPQNVTRTSWSSPLQESVIGYPFVWSLYMQD